MMLQGHVTLNLASSKVETKDPGYRLHLKFEQTQFSVTKQLKTLTQHAKGNS